MKKLVPYSPPMPFNYLSVTSLMDSPHGRAHCREITLHVASSS
jgi:hypothetical protein